MYQNVVTCLFLISVEGMLKQLMLYSVCVTSVDWSACRPTIVCLLLSTCTEHFMSQFFIIPYSLIPGRNDKTVSHISAEHCAQLCVYEDTIVCRSFDYHVSLHFSSVCQVQ